MARLMRILPLLLVPMLAMSLAACDGDGDGETPGDDATTTSAPTTTTGEATTTTGAAAACSASDLDAETEVQGELPGPTAEMRDRIAAAAVACDFDRLAELADEGPGTFTATFGGATDVSAFWQRQEREGGEPMRALRLLLDMPFGTRAVEGSDHYVWPSAFTYEEWTEVPEPERDALRPLYDEDDFESFERFGSYLGYRVGIDEAGNWLFFVRGD